MSVPTRTTVQFTAPKEVDIVTEPIPEPSPDEVRVRTTHSAVSPGTERLIYRGEAPSTFESDATIKALEGALDFPLTYGYAAVGHVEDCGANVTDEWKGRRVFSFQPHTSHFVASLDQVIPLPETVSSRDGVMLPSVETAVNLLMDGAPTIGERVVVLGQGIIGLLTTALLSTYPLETLYTVEPHSERRERSEALGADASFGGKVEDEIFDHLGITQQEAPEVEGRIYEGADLVFEVSGKPSVLNRAISLSGFGGRIVVGSCYGDKEASLQLGSRFHRSRMQIKSSQVSTIAPEYRGRWSKGRRMQVVINQLQSLAPSDLITDVYSLEEADVLYRRLDELDPPPLQPIFQYD
jgi:2-desacetyl-2-hydroxyethyl bacteriochlorophyllide A dehydrogenase